MPAFKDNTQREWLLQLDAPTIRAVRDECQVNLADSSGKELARMAEDPVLLVDVIWVLCRSQAQQHNITADTFGRALVGDAIDHATEALEGAWRSFFPARRRSLLSAMQEKNAAIESKALELTMAKLNDPALLERVMMEMQKNLDAETERVLRSIRSSSATSSPESAESGPTD